MKRIFSFGMYLAGSELARMLAHAKPPPQNNNPSPRPRSPEPYEGNPFFQGACEPRGNRGGFSILGVPMHWGRVYCFGGPVAMGGGLLFTGEGYTQYTSRFIALSG